jgi:hypothetical protein
MWVLLKTLGWIGIGFVAWMLLSVACVSFLYLRGWLNPRRTEKIREYEDAMADGDAADWKPLSKEPAITSVAGPHRAR